MKVSLTPENGAIPSKMVFKKLIGKGHVGRCEARLEAKRNVQKRGVDYDETLTRVVPFSVLLSVVRRFFTKGWHKHHADISITFLTGKLMASYMWSGMTARTDLSKVCKS